MSTVRTRDDGPRVMIVDDHTMLRQGLRRSLESEGIRIVAEAADGEAAVRGALEHRPDVVLMDVSMPSVDGIEATRRLLAADARQRVVVLTMHMDRDVIDRALKAGAVGYMTKDSSVRDVVAAIELAARGGQAISPELAELLARDPDDPSPEPLLSAREQEVLQLIADGLATNQVADRLYISQKTVKNHLASVYEKLGARDRTQAVLIAVKLGIVSIG